MDVLTKEFIEQDAQAYNKKPYASHAISLTHPMNLAIIGKIFGMKLEDLKKARVLEIGCSTGNNIIPFAENYPESYSLGIDISDVQINQGLDLINKIGLKNIELKTLSVTDIDETYGKFDYIICHGVFSWVPIEVQDKILEVCSKNLSPNGIAYISYNSYPGWHMGNTVKEIMKFHAGSFADDDDKISQAELIIDFIKQTTEKSNDAYSNFLKQDLKIIQDAYPTLGKSYLLHEYLGNFNFPFYLHEFINNAGKHGLRYLSDANIATMYLGNYAEKVQETLSKIDSLEKVEQYLDFINYRRFRSSLICHQSVQLNRKIEPEFITSFSISMNVLPLFEVDNTNLDTSEALSFEAIYGSTGTKQQFSTDNTIMKQAFLAFSKEKSRVIAFDDLVTKLAQTLPQFSENDLKIFLATEFTKLMLRGMIRLLPKDLDVISKVPNKPKVRKFNNYLAKIPGFNFAFSQYHVTSFTNVLEKAILEHLDGTNTIKDLKKILIKGVEEGNLNIQKGEEKITNKKEQEEILEQHINQILENFVAGGLLVN